MVESLGMAESDLIYRRNFLIAAAAFPLANLLTRESVIAELTKAPELLAGLTSPLKPSVDDVVCSVLRPTEPGMLPGLIIRMRDGSEAPDDLIQEWFWRGFVAERVGRSSG
jgi:hypothetical protein